MGSNAIIDAAKDAGLAPGEGVRSAINGPPQEDLFDELERDAGKVSQQLRGEAVTRKGRKPGAKNRVTRDVVDYCRRRYVDPLQAMGEISSMTISEVKKHFGFTKTAEAADFWRKMLVDYKNTLYPGSTIADLLREAKDAGVTVVGFAALAGMRPGDHNSAGPDIHGGLAMDDAPVRRAIPFDEETEENQDLSEVDHE